MLLSLAMRAINADISDALGLVCVLVPQSNLLSILGKIKGGVERSITATYSPSQPAENSRAQVPPSSSPASAASAADGQKPSVKFESHKSSTGALHMEGECCQHLLPCGSSCHALCCGMERWAGGCRHTI